MLMQILYSVFLIFMEVYCCTLLFDVFFEKRDGIGKRYYGLLLLMMAAYYLLAYLLENHFFLKETGVVIVSILVMYLCYRASLKKTVIYIFLYIAGGMLVDSLCVMTLPYLFHQITIQDIMGQNGASPFVNILVSVTAKIITYITFLFLRRYLGRRKEDTLTFREWGCFVIFPVFTILVIVTVTGNLNLFEGKEETAIILGFVFGLAVMNVVMYLLLGMLMDRENTIRESEQMYAGMEREIEKYRGISENYEIQQKQVHEYNNRITCITRLVKNRDMEELEKYLKELNENLWNQKNRIDVGHAILNAILNDKLQECCRKKISFIPYLGYLGELKMEGEDVVVIVSNVLNNAIEACEKCSEKYIKFKMVLENGNLIISEQNPLQGNLKRQNGRIQTTKENECREHGIGLANMEEKIKKNQGTCLIDEEKGKFQITIICPN